MTKITQAFIFAAGRGERMRPLTDNIPKPLAKIGKESILAHILKQLDRVDSIQNIVINGYHLADQIADFIKAKNSPKITFSAENDKIETGGGLVFAAKNQKFDPNQPILLINGDILWAGEDDEIEKLANYYFQENPDILLGLKKTDEYFGYNGNGDFDLQENGDLVKNTQENSHVFVGLAIIDPKILKFAPEKSFSMGYFYNNTKNLGLKIKGLELEPDFFHIGDVESLEKVQQFF